MADLFSVTPQFSLQTDTDSDPERLRIQEELTTLLQNSAFLSPLEREKMAKVIPFFSTDIMRDLKETLIRENLRFLKFKSNKHD